MITITPTQCRAARGILIWSQKDLARLCKVSPATIMRLEGGKIAKQLSMDAIISAFKKAGIVFDQPVPGVHDGMVGLKGGIPLPEKPSLDDDEKKEEEESDSLCEGLTKAGQAAVAEYLKQKKEGCMEGFRL
jgi:transcriptional regulator with XRE-family HTH domain